MAYKEPNPFIQDARLKVCGIEDAMRVLDKALVVLATEGTTEGVSNAMDGLRSAHLSLEASIFKLQWAAAQAGFRRR